MERKKSFVRLYVASAVGSTEVWGAVEVAKDEAVIPKD